MTIRFLMSLTAALALLMAPGSARPAAALGPSSACRDLLASLVDDLGAPGGACVVLTAGATADQAASGSDGHGTPMKTSTPTVFGSVSKPMIATVAVRLASAGSINLDEPVATKLPEFSVPGAAEVTPRQLMAHTSGLPFGARHLDVDDPRRRPRDVVAGLDGLELTSSPGTRYTYSSLGYVVLTAWLEAATGRNAAALLGSLDLPDVVTDPGNHTVPPGSRGWLMPPLQAPADGAGLGYGYTAGSATTLAAFARSSMSDRTTLAAMTAGDRPLGWRVDQVEGHRRVWHTGTVPGYFSAVHLVPAKNLAVVLVVNRSGYLDEQRLYDASHLVLARALGAEANQPGPAWLSLGMPLALVALALVGGALAWRHQRVAGGAGLVLVVMAAAAPWALVAVMGMPLRALWLWVPELLVASVVAVLVGAVATTSWLRRRRG